MRDYTGRNLDLIRKTIAQSLEVAERRLEDTAKRANAAKTLTELNRLNGEVKRIKQSTDVLIRLKRRLAKRESS